MAGRVKLLVRNESFFPVSGSTYRILRIASGYSLDTAAPTSITTWSHRMPVARSTGFELRLLNWEFFLERVTKKAED